MPPPGIIFAIGSTAEQKSKVIATAYELMGLSPVVQVRKSTCVYERLLFPVAEGQKEELGSGLFAQEDIESGTYYVVANVDLIKQSADPDHIPSVKRQYALRVENRDQNKNSLWIYPRFVHHNEMRVHQHSSSLTHQHTGEVKTTRETLCFSRSKVQVANPIAQSGCSNTQMLLSLK